MRTSALEIQPVTATVGAVIAGADLTTALGVEAVQTIHAALSDYGVVFFRGQDLTPEQLRVFVANFGTPIFEPFTAAKAEHPVFQYKTTALRQSTAIWHADVTCIPEPVSLIALRALEIPPVGGDTCWANMVAAYEALSAPMRAMLDGLTAVHSARRVMELLGNTNQAALKDHATAVHPVVRVHPETRRKALFVNALWTDRIVELQRAESDEILDLLFEHVKSPEFTMRWRWKPNDIAFFDNRSTQHFAVPDYQASRTMQKVVLAGDRPFGPRT